MMIALIVLAVLVVVVISIYDSLVRLRVLGRDPFDARTRRGIGYLLEPMRLPEYMKAQSFLRYMGGPNVSYH
jgi:ABC-type multidrug transport system ATPase subunit